MRVPTAIISTEQNNEAAAAYLSTHYLLKIIYQLIYQLFVVVLHNHL